MGATGNGFPWPAGTDLLRDGDNAIKALAEAVAAAMWSAGNSNKFRYFSGMYATGTDGRVWIPVTGLTTVNNAIVQIPGPSKYHGRCWQTSGGSVLAEATDYAGNTINSAALTFAILAWGN
jgi:hypothetical protein